MRHLKIPQNAIVTVLSCIAIAAMSVSAFAQHHPQKKPRVMMATSDVVAREKVLRAFLLAGIQHDKEALRRLVLTTSDADLDLLTRTIQTPRSTWKPSSTQAKVNGIFPEAIWNQMIVSEIRFSRIRSLEPGEIVPLPAGERITVPEVLPGNHGVYMKHANMQSIFLLVKSGDRWLVDTKPLIAAYRKSVTGTL